MLGLPGFFGGNLKLLRWIFASDQHVPGLHAPAWELLLLYISIYKPGLFVIGGDFLEMYSVGRFPSLPGRNPKEQLNEEMKVGRALLEQLVDACGPDCEMVYVQGNHEHRLDRFVAQNARALASIDPNEPPMYRTLPEALHLKRLGIKWVPGKAGNGIYTRGKLTFMHGTRTGINAIKAETLAYGGALITGHNHKLQTYNHKAGNGYEVKSMSVGCMCQEPQWMSYDNYTRGWGAGWIEEKSGKYDFWPETLSGENSDELFSPVGLFHAQHRGGGRYKAVRLAGNLLPSR